MFQGLDMVRPCFTYSHATCHADKALEALPESFAQLESLQNVWLDKAQMAMLPPSSRLSACI